MDVNVWAQRRLSTKELIFWSVVLEKTLESPLDCKEIKPVNPKRNQSWIFVGRTDAEAEAPVFWPPDEKSWHIGKEPDIGKRLSAGGKGTSGWDDWMAWSREWPWLWANSGSQWRTGNLGFLQSMGLQRVRNNWATEQHNRNWLWCILTLSYLAPSYLEFTEQF